ncbi:MAG: hypothetical protein H0T76_01895 [Nannocystis sp.]|nr:hypothetical protein [Nannocystis sp.]MBA3545214.1 hypothetical protein [Nannocystis sp.]
MTHCNLKLFMLAALPLCFVAPLGGCARNQPDTARPASSGSYHHDDTHHTGTGSGMGGDSSRGMGSTGSNMGTEGSSGANTGSSDVGTGPRSTDPDTGNSYRGSKSGVGSGPGSDTDASVPPPPPPPPPPPRS